MLVSVRLSRLRLPTGGCAMLGSYCDMQTIIVELGGQDAVLLISIGQFQRAFRRLNDLGSEGMVQLLA